MKSRLLVPIAMSGLMLAIPSCTSRFQTICQATIDCETGNDRDLDACIEQFAGLEEVADAYDCGSFFDGYLTCLRDNSTCGEGKRYSSAGACEAARKDLEQCQDNASQRGK